jgi:hypothetical protein
MQGLNLEHAREVLFYWATSQELTYYCRYK